jgi:hypothetical protein
MFNAYFPQNLWKFGGNVKKILGGVDQKGKVSWRGTLKQCVGYFPSY